jgi:hypothetical protein
MPRSKQGASWVRKAESVDGENELHVGDTVKTFSLRGNPRKTSTPVNSLYLVASPSKLGPMYIAGFASVAAITTEEFKTLKTALGARLSKTVREQIDQATHRMIDTIALKARLHDWKEFEDRLQAIVKTGKACVEAANDLVLMTHRDAPDAKEHEGAISVDRAIKAYISFNCHAKSVVQIDIREILRVCEVGLKEVDQASRRGSKGSHAGAKGHVELQRFLGSMFATAQLAEARITLPSNESVVQHGSKKSTSFFRFVREALNIAGAKGAAAIKATHLTDDEKTRAQHILGLYVKKSDWALLDQLRKVRKSGMQSAQVRKIDRRQGRIPVLGRKATLVH